MNFHWRFAALRLEACGQGTEGRSHDPSSSPGERGEEARLAFEPHALARGRLGDQAGAGGTSRGSAEAEGGAQAEAGAKAKAATEIRRVSAMGATLVTRKLAERRNYEHEGGWTDERVELLKRLWSEGLSCSQIANVMGGGVTRNSVIGKVHRLKLPRRISSTSPRKPRVSRPRIDRAVRAKLRFKPSPKPRQVEPDIAPEQFEFSASAWQPLPGSIPVTMEFMTGCKWPVGNPYGTDMALFCNCVPMEGKPYCREHAERARGKGTVMEQKAVKEAQTTARRERYVPERYAA